MTNSAIAATPTSPLLEYAREKYNADAIPLDEMVRLGLISRVFSFLLPGGKVNTYFIHAPQLDMYKIGRAKDVRVRLRDLQCASPEQLTLVGVIGGDIESLLHYRLRHERSHGEWFRGCEAIRRMVSMKASELSFPQFPNQPEFEYPGGTIVVHGARYAATHPPEDAHTDPSYLPSPERIQHD